MISLLPRIGPGTQWDHPRQRPWSVRCVSRVVVLRFCPWPKAEAVDPLGGCRVGSSVQFFLTLSEDANELALQHRWRLHQQLSISKTDVRRSKQACFESEWMWTCNLRNIYKIEIQSWTTWQLRGVPVVYVKQNFNLLWRFGSRRWYSYKLSGEHAWRQKQLYEHHFRS